MATAVLASIGDHGDELLALPIPSLRDPDWTPLWPPALDHKADAIFHAIQSADLLVHHLTGHADKPNCTSLLVAPLTMRPRLLDLIHRETQNQRAGLPARIIAKMNQVEDPDIIEALCEASQAGVSIDLIIRGFCCLRPGVPGHTENIRIRSIIGRFLEHSRILYFADGKQNPAEGEYYIGLADWMYRNLSKRIEVVTPVFATGPETAPLGDSRYLPKGPPGGMGAGTDRKVRAAASEGGGDRSGRQRNAPDSDGPDPDSIQPLAPGNPSSAS
jgi:polyphosphate kinase